MTVEVVEVGAPSGVATVTVGGEPAGTAQVGVVVLSALDDLTDVDGASAATTGQVLARSTDGQWRPATPTGGPGPGPGQGFVFVQNAPMSAFQISHGLPFKPAGVTSVDTSGAITECESITHPALGITEITYGADFTGTVFLS